jgi:cytidylate kinase
MIRTIAIDGPAGSGKSTVGAAVARRQGFLYFDTGVMYRCVALAALRERVATTDEPAVSDLAERIQIAVEPSSQADGRQNTIRLDDEDVTWAIRGADVEAQVSRVAAYPRVRMAMVEQQRRVAQSATSGIVMVGRDIGTVVLPDADLKVYLDASPEERAQRRHWELVARGGPDIPDYDQVLAGVRQRDAVDSGRITSPLRPAPDAVIIDSTDLPVDAVIARIAQLIGQTAAA